MLFVLETIFFILAIGGVGFGVFQAEDIKRERGKEALKKDTTVTQTFIIACISGVLFAVTMLGTNILEQRVEYKEEIIPITVAYSYTAPPYSNGRNYDDSLIVCKSQNGDKIEFWGVISDSPAGGPYVRKRTPQMTGFQKFILLLDDEWYLFADQDELQVIKSDRDLPVEFQ